MRIELSSRFVVGREFWVTGAIASQDLPNVGGPRARSVQLKVSEFCKDDCGRIRLTVNVDAVIHDSSTATIEKLT
ncbi:hypothetical protein MU0083_003936 [[Mycobacterium] kokjensenii]|uniref:Uncharacterized protein n=1 Tax=[Mycobacterium] kokjensenii TaxID=3064287 RepID=A0ABM9LXH3_9MYCO|nr:hypothetical protein [Mycolicibacter sp. MU0083]CAJ1506400.1 hypothetical protein MU0083_003936 [Mycolicibacter sp. MU0083]